MAHNAMIPERSWYLSVGPYYIYSAQNLSICSKASKHERCRAFQVNEAPYRIYFAPRSQYLTVGPLEASKRGTLKPPAQGLNIGSRT